MDEWHCWLVQQCEAGTRRPLLDKPAVAPKFDQFCELQLPLIPFARRLKTAVTF
jgi:hypothetical protein